MLRHLKISIDYPVNPKHPVSDQDRISPKYTISCRQVMKIKKNINFGITN